MLDRIGLRSLITLFIHLRCENKLVFVLFCLFYFHDKSLKVGEEKHEPLGMRRQGTFI